MKRMGRIRKGKVWALPCKCCDARDDRVKAEEVFEQNQAALFIADGDMKEDVIYDSWHDWEKEYDL